MSAKPPLNRGGARQAPSGVQPDPDQLAVKRAVKTSRDRYGETGPARASPQVAAATRSDVVLIRLRPRSSGPVQRLGCAPRAMAVSSIACRGRTEAAVITNRFEAVHLRLTWIHAEGCSAGLSRRSSRRPPDSSTPRSMWGPFRCTRGVTSKVMTATCPHPLERPSRGSARKARIWLMPSAWRWSPQQLRISRP